MLEKARQGKHGGHPSYSHNGTATKITGSHSQTSGGENTTSCCTTGSPWRSISARLLGLKEFRLRIIGFLRQILQE